MSCDLQSSSSSSSAAFMHLTRVESTILVTSAAAAEVVSLQSQEKSSSSSKRPWDGLDNSSGEETVGLDSQWVEFLAKDSTTNSTSQACDTHTPIDATTAVPLHGSSESVSDDQESIVSDYSSCTDDDDYESEEETAVAKALSRAMHSRASSTPALTRLLDMALQEHIPSVMVSTENRFRKKARFVEAEEIASTLTTRNSHQPIIMKNTKTSCSHNNQNLGMRISESAPASLHELGAKADPSMNNQESSPSLVHLMNKALTPKPDDFLQRLLPHAVPLMMASSLKDFFVPLTQANIDAYDLALAKAVRAENVELMRFWLQNGNKTFHAGNRFGETIVHAACRRASVTVLRFLIHEAGVPLRVCCDGGRTPLHDACWAPGQPQWEVMELLLDAVPEFLYITDARGHTPLQYVRDEHHREWCDFLQARGCSKLLPSRKMLEKQQQEQ